MVKNLIKMLLCAIIFITTGILAYSSIHGSRTINTNTQDSAYIQSVNSVRHISDSLELMTEHKKDSLRGLMVKEAQSFIKERAPKAHTSIAYLIVDNGLKHNIDIAFIMAQTQFETNFGTTGAGRPTSRYSLFGVNGKFTDYSDAITKYIALLENSYLTSGRTEQHLMRKYTTKGGYRYSTNPNYEKNLRKYYKGVLEESNIRDFQKQYQNLVI